MNVVPIEDLRLITDALALGFCNTQTLTADGTVDLEGLTEFADLLHWAEAVGCLSESEREQLKAGARSDPAGATSVFSEAIALREVIRGIFTRLASGATPEAADLAALRDAETGALRNGELEAGPDGYAWRWTSAAGLALPLHRITHAAVELLMHANVGRIKQCSGCSFLFLDESKNGSRRWCSMLDCGADDKARRYVARRAATRRQASGGFA